jgi:capsular polysaccharide transport system permease protein
MTTRPKALKFRIRRSMPLTAVQGGADPAAPLPQLPKAAVVTTPTPTPEPLAEAASPGLVAAEADLDAIRREGLTGRQLRMARRVAQKQGLAVTSDFDAVRQLRARGIDPFETAHIFELVQPTGGGSDAMPLPQVTEGGVPVGRIQLPQTVPERGRGLPSTERRDPGREAAAGRRAEEIMKIQRDIARRRRRKLALLFSRLTLLVFIPTLLTGYYFYAVATPMYATNSEFVVKQAESSGIASGIGGLFQGTQLATNQDSQQVQAFLTSREAFQRLDAEHDFMAQFSAETIDPIQRLAADATREDGYDTYRDHVLIKYDPTEGIIKMEVIAPDPATGQAFSEALIAYAEEQVDALSLRLREDQMQGARDSYAAAEERRADALAEWLRIQQEVQQIDPVGETAARTQQISALETERQQLQLQLEQRLSVERPNQAQVDSLRSQIGSIETLIAELRSQMTQDTADGGSLASKNTELRLAEENYTFQTLMVQQAQTQMEAAQIEANRQVRYLETGVAPVAPDRPTYPRAFENTLVALLIFAGIYLMLSLTVSILREQVTS